MHSITLSSEGKRDLRIEKVYEKQYLDETNSLSYEIWINSHTSEILDPIFYGLFNNMEYGNCININTTEYCVTKVEVMIRHS